MTPLEPKAVRDANGIDTFERALVYAALLLRASNTSSANAAVGSQNKYLGAVRIAANPINLGQTGIESILTIQIKLPYDNNVALRSGGNFFENIKEYGNTDPFPFLLASPATSPNSFLITQEPLWVTTLEKYSMWVANNLTVGYLALNPKVQPPVTSNFLEEDSPEPSVTINATLKFDLDIYLESNNLMAAVKSEIKSGLTIAGEEDEIFAAGGTP